MTPQVVIRLLSLLTLLSNIGVAFYLLLFLLKNFAVVKEIKQKFEKYFSRNALKFSLIVALTATLGSLYFSEVAGFTPCVLCWYQRIFMYPLAFILFVANKTKSKDAGKYVLPLSLVGLTIALYHYLIQINPNIKTPCSTVGFSASCSERFVTEFGYITIPWMAFSAFALIIIGMLLLRRKKA